MVDTKFGLLPDSEDFRDIEWKSGQVKPESNVDLRNLASPIENQFRLNSCTMQAIVGVMEALQNKEGKEFVDLSRLFGWQMELLLEGTFGLNAGAYIRDGIKVVFETGICKESLWPYDPSKIKEMPPKECFDDASTRKIKKYVRINSLNDARECMTLGFPFVFGHNVYQSTYSQNVMKSGNIPLPSRWRFFDKLLGGHAVSGFGYNDFSENIIVRGSYSNTVGDKGYFYLPYEFFNRYVSDCWAIFK